MADKDSKEVQELAEAHVDWLISFIVPIIRKFATEEFVHGYKHGVEDKQDEAEK